MSCKELTDFLAEYLDGSLPRWQRVAMKFHLLLCRDCRRYLKSYATTIALAHAIGQPVPEDDAPIPQGTGGSDFECSRPRKLIELPAAARGGRGITASQACVTF